MNGLPVARIAGFEIRLHLTWVLILAVVTILSGDGLIILEPGWPDWLRWVAGGIIALGFLGSVLMHELAHALAARRRGLMTTQITLYFFGGSASLELEAPEPANEVFVASAGPVASLALGLGLIAAGLGFGVLDGLVPTLLGEILIVVGALNLVLGLINLIPGFPLDGGRIVRAIVWSRTGSERRGSRAAALAGRSVAWLLVGAGLVYALQVDPVDGLMIVLSGWFLSGAARATERRLALEDLLAGIRVDEAMERDLPTVAPQLTLDTFADRYLGAGAEQSLPVVLDTTLLGLIGVSQIRRIARRAWATTRAGDVMVSPPTLDVLAPGDELWQAIQRLRRSGLDGLPVVDGSSLLGVLTRRAVVSAIQSRARPKAEGAG